MKVGRGYFITGTDTNVGKTWSTVALMRHLQGKGLTVAAMKPVAAGCQWLDGTWKNDDAMLLQAYSSLELDYAQVNPYAFEQPVSPHVACGGANISLPLLNAAFAELSGLAEVVLVEGAGGWYSPLDNSLSNADLAKTLRLPVILVVGLRLGCINHALLTRRAIRQSGMVCAGWVAVALDPLMQAMAENLAYLRETIDAPMLGVLPYQESADFGLLAEFLDCAIWRDIDLDQNP